MNRSILVGFEDELQKIALSKEAISLPGLSLLKKIPQVLRGGAKSVAPKVKPLMSHSPVHPAGVFGVPSAKTVIHGAGPTGTQIMPVAKTQKLEGAIAGYNPKLESQIATLPEAFPKATKAPTKSKSWSFTPEALNKMPMRVNIRDVASQPAAFGAKLGAAQLRMLHKYAELRAAAGLN